MTARSRLTFDFTSVGDARRVSAVMSRDKDDTCSPGTFCAAVEADGVKSVQFRSIYPASDKLNLDHALLHSPPARSLTLFTLLACLTFTIVRTMIVCAWRVASGRRVITAVRSSRASHQTEAVDGMPSTVPPSDVIYA